MIKSAPLLLAIAAVIPRLLGAQSAGIRGVVRDSAERAVMNADVVVIPGNKHARTDSAGRFSFESLEKGQYTVRARRFGYGPGEWTVDLSSGGRTEIALTLGARIAVLDTVFVADGRPCERDKFEGFMCRRASAKGMFIDYTDIDTMDVIYSADILSNTDGFRTLVRPTRNGPTRVASAKECTIVLMDGVPASWTVIPEDPYMIIAVEIYKKPREIPKEFHRYTWGKERCWLVAYWTANFNRPFAKASLPRP